MPLFYYTINLNNRYETMRFLHHASLLKLHNYYINCAYRIQMSLLFLNALSKGRIFQITSDNFVNIFFCECPTVIKKSVC